MSLKVRVNKIKSKVFVLPQSRLGILFTWPFFPQIGWAVPTECLAFLPALTADDEFHAWGPLAQVQMSTGRAGNRYHKQRAMLFILFCLTYFSTQNSNTQVSASNPVLLFHCSCHQSWDKKKKGRRRDCSRGAKLWKFTRALFPLALLSHPLNELDKAQNSA